MLPEPGEELDAEALVRHYLPERVPSLTGWHRVGAQILAIVPATYLGLLGSYLVLGADLGMHPGRLAILGLTWALGAVAGELILRRHFRLRTRQFEWDLASGKVHESIARRFRGEIEAQRSRTLGPDSEWANARAPLEAAADEASRSAAYWSERLTMEPTNEVASNNLEAARRLDVKFKGAIGEIDQRMDVLREFFNQCEAKLSVLEYSKRDYEESRRLAALSDRAEDVIADTSLTLELIGQQFIADAVRVAQALGGLERLRLLEHAGDVPLDQLEAVADQIIETSAKERATLQALVEGIEG